MKVSLSHPSRSPLSFLGRAAPHSLRDTWSHPSQHVTHERAAPVQSVLAGSSPASGDLSSPAAPLGQGVNLCRMPHPSPPPGPLPTPRLAQHSVPISVLHLPPHQLGAGSDEALKRSRAQACPCRPLRHRHSSQTSLTFSAPRDLMLLRPSSRAPPLPVLPDRAIACRTSWPRCARHPTDCHRLVRHTRPQSQQCQ